MGLKIAKKNISTLCFLLLWSVQETTCFIKKHKLIEFQEKLQEMVASSSPIPPPSPAVSQTKQSGRVFYPIGYGADPTGVQDSGDAILNALNDAFQVQNGLQLLPGVNDLGGVVIDLQGGNYKISMPLRFPASGGGNVVVKGGTLRASDIFPGDRHLIEVWSQNSQVLDKRNKEHDPNGFPAGKLQDGAILYEDITFRDILFDSGSLGGGLVVDSARIRINNSFLLHFTTEGILVQGGHGTFVSSCFLGQHSTVGRGPGERDFSGTATDLWSNDNAITDVLFSAAIVVLSRGRSNILLGVLNVVMGKAPDIGNASCASPEVFCPSSIFFSVFFMIAQHCPGQSNCVSKRHNVDISCFIHVVQVRKISFTGSTAVGKKLMAVAAGTVKRLAAKFCNSGQTCVCANRIIGQEGIFDKFADAFSKAVQSMQVGDGFSEGVAQIGGECALTSQTGGLDF